MRSPVLALASFLLVGAAACGGRSTPAEEPAVEQPRKKPKASKDPDVRMLAHTWLIEEHLMVKGASISSDDAESFHGRTFVITPTGYSTPFHPPCENAAWQKSQRDLNDLVKELLVTGNGASKAAEAGLTSDLVEFRLTCTDRGKPPPVIVWVGGDHAMSCYAGACYVMKRFED